MVQEPKDKILVNDETPIENNSFKIVYRKNKGKKSWQETQPQVEEEHWQWTSLKRKKSPVFHSPHENGSSISNEPTQPEFSSYEVLEEPTLGFMPLKAIPNKTKAIEKIIHTNDFESIEKLGAQSHSKYAVQIPQLELTKIKEIALQAKLEARSYICQDSEVAVATNNRGELGLQRRYPCLLVFCIFLNLLSILSFLFCISVLKIIYPHPAY